MFALYFFFVSLLIQKYCVIKNAVQKIFTCGIEYMVDTSRRNISSTSS